VDVQVELCNSLTTRAVLERFCDKSSQKRSSIARVVKESHGFTLLVRLPQRGVTSRVPYLRLLT